MDSSGPIAASTSKQYESESQSTQLEKAFKTPVQDKLSLEISVLRAKKDALLMARDAGLDDTADREIKKLKLDLKAKEQALLSAKKNAEYQRKFRENRAKTIKDLLGSNSTSSKVLTLRDEPGRPTFKENDKLMETIVDLVLLKTAADSRRRTEMLRAYRTLDDLHEAVTEKGFNISRSGLYIRLLPRNSTTLEGKRHVPTVPVSSSYEGLTSFYIIYIILYPRLNYAKRKQKSTSSIQIVNSVSRRFGTLSPLLHYWEPTRSFFLAKMIRLKSPLDSQRRISNRHCLCT